MKDDRGYFQQVSSELEAGLEEYKNRYPKNLAQMFRHNFGKITVLSAAAFFFIGIFSMSITMVLFLFVGLPGVFIFALTVHFNNKAEQIQDDKDMLERIKGIKKKLQPLISYPDVKKYCEGFDKKVEAVTAEKNGIKAKFRRYATTAAISAAAVFVVLVVRVEICNQLGLTDGIIATPDETYLDEVLDIKHDEPFFRLKNLTTGGNDVEFFVGKWHDLSVSGVNMDLLKDTRATYALIITDKDGKFVPRCPKFYLNFYSCNIEAFLDEPLRMLKFLRDNQQDLRYKLEKIN